MEERVIAFDYKCKGIYNICNNYNPAWYILQCDSGVKGGREIHEQYMKAEVDEKKNS
jgi:hypothetical protein